jgi:D-alanyl-D-alanine dipeptidase
MNDLVYIDEHGLQGTNFYWNKYESKGLTKEDILVAGLTSDRVQVHKDIIGPLIAIDAEFQKRGYRLYIKEGYRSKELYEIVYKRRVEKFGKEETDRLLNMKDMPHAAGKSVDVSLRDKETDEEVFLRNVADGTNAMFVDFYKNKTDEASKKYQDLQEFVISAMLAHGFKLGTKNEYFHFDYSPQDLIK